ncbi:hypothetical protein ACEXQE_02145 [Herbiconiux sp. P17]|uniref:hypothetical protein n=1 Tax=Herbiconiux wuyangfengii TaxID=3342794 RepID=UPI0035BB0793
MPKSLKEILDRIAEEDADLFEKGEPIGPGRDIDQDALQRLTSSARARDMAERDLTEAVTAARATGMSWVSIGLSVGTTGEAARQRYGKVKRTSA